MLRFEPFGLSGAIPTSLIAAVPSLRLSPFYLRTTDVPCRSFGMSLRCTFDIKVMGMLLQTSQFGLYYRGAFSLIHVDQSISVLGMLTGYRNVQEYACRPDFRLRRTCCRPTSINIADRIAGTRGEVGVLTTFVGSFGMASLYSWQGA